MAAVDSTVHRQSVATAMDIGCLQADVRALGGKLEETHATLTERIREYRDVENLRHEELMKRLDERHEALMLLLGEREESTREDLNDLSDTVQKEIPALAERITALEKQQARVQWIGGAVVAGAGVAAWLWEHIVPKLLPAMLALSGSSLLLGC